MICFSGVLLMILFLIQTSINKIHKTKSKIICKLHIASNSSKVIALKLEGLAKTVPVLPLGFVGFVDATDKNELEEHGPTVDIGNFYFQLVLLLFLIEPKRNSSAYIMHAMRLDLVRKGKKTLFELLYSKCGKFGGRLLPMTMSKKGIEEEDYAKPNLLNMN